MNCFFKKRVFVYLWDLHSSRAQTHNPEIKSPVLYQKDTQLLTAYLGVTRIIAPQLPLVMWPHLDTKGLGNVAKEEENVNFIEKLPSLCHI